MLDFPTSTVIHRALPKTSLFASFSDRFTPKQRRHFDQNVSRMTLVNELSSRTLRLPATVDISCIYVLHIAVKSLRIDKTNLRLLPQLTGQYLLMHLECDAHHKLAILYNKLYETDWLPPDRLSAPIHGLDLAQVYQNFVRTILSIPFDAHGTLDEQIALKAQRDELTNRIARLEKQSWSEKSPALKLDLIRQLRELQSELELLDSYQGSVVRDQYSDH